MKGDRRALLIIGPAVLVRVALFSFAENKPGHAPMRHAGGAPPEPGSDS
ncbi:MAG TPA: hypothetical protein VGL59_22185 [Polyangia bacterium]|jgi:hypothetical protein